MPKARLKYKTNPIYTKYVPDYKGRYLFYFGGGGSGKSYDMYYRLVKRIITQHEANHKILVIRKVAATIEESVWDGVKAIIDQMGFTSLFEFKKQGRIITYKINGNKIVMRGLDNPEKVKSITGVTSVYIEEVTELTENDFLQLGLRLRGKHKTDLQIVAAFNPVDKDHWLCKHVEPQINGDSNTPEHVTDLNYLCDEVWEFNTVSKSGKKTSTRVINTNYKHNRFIDDEYIDYLQTLGVISKNYYTVYVLGRWGRADVGDLFIHTFSEAKHVYSNIKPKPYPVHYTVDFNVNPYMSGVVAQLEYIENGYWNGYESYYELTVLDEMAMKHPRNDARSLGEEIEARHDLSMGWFLYGDASGNNRNGTRDVKTLFSDLKEGLSTSNPIERIPKSNPKYKSIAKGSLGRAAFINLLFNGSLPVRIKISDKCTEFIKDLKWCVQGNNGNMDKKKRDGHHLDAFTYFVCHPESLGFLAKKR